MKCDRCDGCGKIANSESGEAWTSWLALPLGSALAVTMGLVRPIDCPRCKGTGRVGVHAAVCGSCTCEVAP